jgi:hypothetical protein
MREDFDFLFGTWAVEHRFRRRWLDDCDEWDELPGGAVCAPVLGGGGNVDQIWVEGRGVVGATFRLYDVDAGHWTIHWGSAGAGRLDPPMTGRFADGVGTFHGEDVHGDRPVAVRFVWDDISPTTARWTQAFAPSGKRDYEDNWVMRFQRVSTEADSATTRPGVVPPPG